MPGAETEPDQSALRKRAQPILALMGVTRPSSARVEYARYMVGLDDSARVMLTMSQDDWLSLRAAPPVGLIAPDQYRRDEVYSLGGNDGTWRPREDDTALAAQMPLSAGRYLDVGFAPIGEGRVRVYLFWFET